MPISVSELSFAHTTYNKMFIFECSSTLPNNFYVYCEIYQPAWPGPLYLRLLTLCFCVCCCTPTISLLLFVDFNKVFLVTPQPQFQLSLSIICFTSNFLLHGGICDIFYHFTFGSSCHFVLLLVFIFNLQFLFSVCFVCLHHSQ